MDWKIEVRNYRCFVDSSPLAIDLTNKSTAIIGPNNAGKSAILRFFWEFGHLIYQIPNAIQEHSKNDGYARIPISSDSPRTQDLHSLFAKFGERPIQIDLKQTNVLINPIDIGHYSEKCVPIHIRIVLAKNSNFAQVLIIEKQKVIENLSQSKTVRYHDQGISIKTPNSSEINYIRFREFYELDSPTFLPSVRSYARSAIDNDYGLTLGLSVVSAWSGYKVAESSASWDFAKDVEDELARIFGYVHLNIMANGTGRDLIVDIDNKMRVNLRDMGDGIAQFLTILLNIKYRENSLVLFDEPEAGLHASLQQELIRLVLKYSKGNLIFATHSIGLARAAADEVISLVREGQVTKAKPMDASPSYLETLGELSFSAWREIGCDGVLFVEGPSDVQVMSEWLKKVGLANKWAILSLGGRTTIHANGFDAIRDVMKVHHRVAVIIDSEKKNKDAKIEIKRQKFQKSCSNAGIPCLVMERRAIENYFTSDALQRALGVSDSLEPFQELGGCWHKSSNNKVAAAMSIEAIEGTDILRFIRSVTE
jgi:predicted ATP-dependent endonuclease of OLD family